MLETATIEPPTPASIMACAPARMVSQVPVRLTASTRSHCAGCCFSSRPDAPIPAQVTIRVGAPCSRTVRSIASETASGSLTSQAISASSEIPHDDVVARVAQPPGDLTPDSGRTAGH